MQFATIDASTTALPSLPRMGAPPTQLYGGLPLHRETEVPDGPLPFGGQCQGCPTTAAAMSAQCPGGRVHVSLWCAAVLSRAQAGHNLFPIFQKLHIQGTSGTLCHCPRPVYNCRRCHARLSPAAYLHDCLFQGGQLL